MERSVGNVPGRADLAVGIVLLAGFYAVESALRGRSQTAVERLAVDVKRVGRAGRLGAGGFVRLALAEGRLLDRVPRRPPRP